MFRSLSRLVLAVRLLCAACLIASLASCFNGQEHNQPLVNDIHSINQQLAQRTAKFWQAYPSIYLEGYLQIIEGGLDGKASGEVDWRLWLSATQLRMEWLGFGNEVASVIDIREVDGHKQLTLWFDPAGRRQPYRYTASVTAWQEVLSQQPSQRSMQPLQNLLAALQENQLDIREVTSNPKGQIVQMESGEPFDLRVWYLRAEDSRLQRVEHYWQDFSQFNQRSSVYQSHCEQTQLNYRSRNLLSDNVLNGVIGGWPKTITTTVDYCCDQKTDATLQWTLNKAQLLASRPEFSAWQGQQKQLVELAEDRQLQKLLQRLDVAAEQMVCE